jgi:hypothetical protein
MDFLGQPTNLAGKPKGNNSMSVKQTSAKACSAVWPASPVRMVKPELVEPKFPVVSSYAHRSIPDAVASQYAQVFFMCSDTQGEVTPAERSLW